MGNVSFVNKMQDVPIILNAKVYRKPHELVYVNYFKDGKWVKTDKRKLDEYGYLRTTKLDTLKTFGEGTYQLRVYFFSNAKNIWTKELKFPAYFTVGN